MCGGTDRWRFDDINGTGRWWCNSCGRGNGVDLVMTWKTCNFMEAVKLVESVIGGSRLSVRRSSEPDISDQKNAMRKTWLRSLELNGKDVASRYLRRRDLALPQWPPCLRWAVEMPYWLDREMVGYFPVLLARYVAPDDKTANILRTYLSEPGKKAEVPEARKMMAGPVPYGGAVRLADPAEEMGVAEGIETALAASVLYGVPVWAVLSTAGLLRFQPPPICKKLIIFGDRDEKYAGQASAYALGHRLETARQPVETEVRVPDSGSPAHPWVKNKIDWNDVLTRDKLQRGMGLRLVK
jgi:putative DNA primase/helicase